MAGPSELTTAVRKPGLEHIPIYPHGFIAVRIVQLAMGFIALGLSAFGVWGFPISGACLTLFVAIATLITTTWLLVAHFANPKLYNYWAVLALDIFLVIFWLVAFAVLASEVSVVYNYLNYSYSSYSYYYTGNPLEDKVFSAWLACQAAGAGVGAALFVLFIVSLVFHIMALHRHRAAGLHSNPGAAATPAAPSSGPAPGAEKTNPTGAYHGAPAPQAYPAPVYTQQTAAYPPQQQQQFYDPSATTSPVPAAQAQQGFYAPQQQYGDAQYQPQYQPQYEQQQMYPPTQTSSPPPLSAQYTGGSAAPGPDQPVQQPHNNAVEVPAQSYQPQPQPH